MRRIVIGVVIVAAVAAGVYWSVNRSRPDAERANPGIPAVKAPSEIVAEARVVPVRGVTLSVQAGGTVAEIPIKEGDRVQRGQVLLRTDAARQAEASVAQAEATLRRARARLAELVAGPRPQDVETARSTVAAAEARYSLIAAGAREQERRQAQALVDQAESRADAAQQRVVQAESALRLAEEDLRRAEALLAQNAISRQSVDQARTALTAARADADAARAERSAAAAQAASARQQLSLVRAGARREELDAAAADVRRAKAQLDLLLAGARPETIRAAEADVASAGAAVRQAQAALAQTVLTAPFDATVAWLGPKAGEFMPPGAPVIRIGDLSAWQIETTDLTELSIVSVRRGSRVIVKFDGIPGLELPGTVRHIKAFGENRLGDITYTVTVTLDRQDARLYWNMTASVAIEPKP